MSCSEQRAASSEQREVRWLIGGRSGFRWCHGEALYGPARYAIHSAPYTAQLLVRTSVWVCSSLLGGVRSTGGVADEVVPPMASPPAWMGCRAVAGAGRLALARGVPLTRRMPSTTTDLIAALPVTSSSSKYARGRGPQRGCRHGLSHVTAGTGSCSCTCLLASTLAAPPSAFGLRCQRGEGLAWRDPL